MKRIPLAWYNLLYDRTRLGIAIAGVAFAVLLMFMNLGFFGALVRTSSNFYDNFNGDLFLISPKSLDISSAKPFPRERLYQAAGFEGVARTMPLYTDYALWKNPLTNDRRAMFVYGFNPNDPAFLLPELQDPVQLRALQQPNTTFIDRRSRPEFGPTTIGIETEAARRKITIVGQYSLGGGFAADGTLIMSDQNFQRYFAPHSLSRINLGLVLLKPGVDPQQVKAILQKQLPADVRVYTRNEIVRRESRYWVQTTSLGFIFSLGVMVSFIIGTVIVYQVLYTDIQDHMREYATLKAIGYGSRYLFNVVIQEAVILSFMGFVPGLIIALGLYELASNATADTLPMEMPLFRVAFVLILTVLMCSLSGLISVRKAVTADPAEVFA